MNSPAFSTEPDFYAMQKMLANYPKAAQSMEAHGQIEEAGKLYRELARTVEKVETMPRKIYSPSAFGLLAQYLERRGQTAEAMRWYEKLANAPVNAHANTVKAEYLQRYAGLLLKSGDKDKARTIEAEAALLIESHKRLNASGADY